MLARVMTFYSESTKIGGLVTSLREELPHAYHALPGFRGLLVLEKPGANHVIALTLWKDEEGVQASETLAESYADQIHQAAGVAVSRNVYTVLGVIGISGPDPSTE